jgi:transcriptional regulator with XRE-family HTH domain
MKTSNLIKEYREKRNMTQKQLSEALCYDNPQFVSLLENGHSKLPPYMMKSFCEALRIKPEVMKKALVSDYSERLDQYMRDQ